MQQEVAFLEAAGPALHGQCQQQLHALLRNQEQRQGGDTLYLLPSRLASSLPIHTCILELLNAELTIILQTKCVCVHVHA